MPKQTIPTAESRQDNRGVWRIGRGDVEEYLEQAYQRTAEKTASGDFDQSELPAD